MSLAVFDLADIFGAYFVLDDSLLELTFNGFEGKILLTDLADC